MDKETIRRIYDPKRSLQGLDYFEIIHEVRLMRGDEPDGLPVSNQEIAMALSGDEEIEWPVQSAEEAEAEIIQLYGRIKLMLSTINKNIKERLDNAKLKP
jgi:hypothetical protein